MQVGRHAGRQARQREDHRRGSREEGPLHVPRRRGQRVVHGAQRRSLCAQPAFGGGAATAAARSRGRPERCEEAEGAEGCGVE